MKKIRNAILIILGIGAIFITYLFSEPYFYQRKLNREILDISLQKGTSFLLNNQKQAGNFTYEYDFNNHLYPEGDSQVRQAGALWGLALIHHDKPTKETFVAVDKGLDFFLNLSKKKNDQVLFIDYPGGGYGKTGTVALVALACVEMLQAPMDSAAEVKYTNALDGYIQFLLSLHREDGRFYGRYETKNGDVRGEPSPYFDGETLLALSKAAIHLGYDELKPLILNSAEAMYQEYVVKAREDEKDSPITKGFYQWGSMAFFEIYKAGWGEHYAERIINLAYWMIDIHQTLTRQKNTAYAQEGIIVAYETARLTNDLYSMKKFAAIVDRVLIKLTSWQVGGPLKNNYLMNHPTEDPNAIGGIMNCRNCPVLRIDVTQHQMHAVILARKYVYK